MFNTELDMLEVRLMELYDVVDYFVIGDYRTSCHCNGVQGLDSCRLLTFWRTRSPCKVVRGFGSRRGVKPHHPGSAKAAVLCRECSKI